MTARGLRAVSVCHRPGGPLIRGLQALDLEVTDQRIAGNAGIGSQHLTK